MSVRRVERPDGKLHRINGTKEWWLNGKLLTEEEFNNKLYRTLFCGDQI